MSKNEKGNMFDKFSNFLEKNTGLDVDKIKEFKDNSTKKLDEIKTNLKETSVKVSDKFIEIKNDENNRQLVKNIVSDDTINKSRMLFFKTLSIILKIITFISATLSITFWICGQIQGHFPINDILSKLTFSFLFWTLIFFLLSVKFKSISTKAYLFTLDLKKSYKKMKSVFSQTEKYLPAELRSALLRGKNDMRTTLNDLRKFIKSIDLPGYDPFITERRLIMERKKKKPSQKKINYLSIQTDKLKLFYEFLKVSGKDARSITNLLKDFKISNLKKMDQMKYNEFLEKISGFGNRINIYSTNLMSELSKKQNIEIKNDNYYNSLKKILKIERSIYGWRPSILSFISLIISLFVLFLVCLGIVSFFYSLAKMPGFVLASPYFLAAMGTQFVSMISLIINLINFYFLLLNLSFISAFIISLTARNIIKHNSGLLKGIFITRVSIFITILSGILIWIMILLVIITGYAILSN